VKEHKYGFFQDGKIYRKGFLDYPDKVIGEVRTSEEATLKYFEDRFEIAKKKIEFLEQQIEEAENKGSYLMKLIHLRVFLGEFDGLGDFVPLYEKLDKLEIQLKELITINRHKNLEIKRALLAEIEEAVNLENLDDASTKIEEIKQKWIKTGSVEKEFEGEIEGQFSSMLRHLFERKKENYLRRKAEIDEKVKAYQAIIYKAERLREENDRAVAMRQLRILREEWKNVGMVPKLQMNQLWKRFKYLSDSIFNKGRPSTTAGMDSFSRRPYDPTARRSFDPSKRRFPPRESQRLPDDFEGNARKMEQLIYLVEQLKGRKDDLAVSEVKKFQKIWSEVGKVPPEKFKELSGKFFGTCDEILEDAFLEKLANAGAEYAKKSESEKIRYKIRLLYDSLTRDEKELESLLGRIGNFGADQKLEKMTGMEISIKKRKIRIKKKMLSDLKRYIERQF
jgi:hypothetical protein